MNSDIAVDAIKNQSERRFRDGAGQLESRCSHAIVVTPRQLSGLIRPVF